MKDIFEQIDQLVETYEIHPQIEKMIIRSAMNGELSKEEKQIITNKAKELGEDVASLQLFFIALEKRMKPEPKKEEESGGWLKSFVAEVNKYAPKEKKTSAHHAI